MTRPTISNLMDFHVFAVLKRLKAWMKPLQEITEEVHVLSDPDNIVLIGENGVRMRFDRDAIDVVRKTFRSAEWYLTAPYEKEEGGIKGLSLLIGVLPKNHYLTLAPKKEKQPSLCRPE